MAGYFNYDTEYDTVVSRSTRIFAIYPTIESRHPTPRMMISEGTDTRYREVVPGDGTLDRSHLPFPRSLLAVIETAKGQRGQVRSFRGECRSRISRSARYDKVARYLVDEGERNKFRTADPPQVRNWTPYENSSRDLNMLLKVSAQVKLRFNFESRVSIDRIKLLVRTLRSKI